MQKQKNVLTIRTVKSPADLFDLTEEFGTDKPLKRIFQIVLSQGCESILVEPGYDDPEYSNEYDSFYKKLFKTYSNKTHRLHFFRCPLRRSDLSDLSRLRSKYLGFCVLRPFQFQKVVNAIIKPVEDRNRPKRSFILCQKPVRVEIKVSNNNTQRL